MLAKLKRFGYERAYGVLKSRGASCPQCAASLNLPVALPKGAGILSCDSCAWSGDVMSLLRVPSDDPEQLEQPAGSKIVRKEEADGSTVWLMPASKTPNGLLVFGVIWTSMIGFMAFMVLTVVMGNVLAW